MQHHNLSYQLDEQRRVVTARTPELRLVGLAEEHLVFTANLESDLHALQIEVRPARIGL